MACPAGETPVAERETVIAKFVAAEIGKGVEVQEMGRLPPDIGVTDCARLINMSFQRSLAPGIHACGVAEPAVPFARGRLVT